MGTVVWFTGLSGSGKTTIALGLKERLRQLGKKVDIIDGDVVRNTLHRHLGFSREDIKENNQLIAELAAKRKDEFDFVVIPIISPYKEDREKARGLVGTNFLELFVNASLKTCIERDIKGLYKKAFSGEITNLIGVSKSNPYEPPENPDLKIVTDKTNVEENVDKIISFLKEKDLL